MRAKSLAAVSVLVLVAGASASSHSAEAPASDPAAAGPNVPIQGVVPDSDADPSVGVSSPSKAAAPPWPVIEELRRTGRMTLPNIGSVNYSVAVEGSRVIIRTSKPVRFARPRRRLRNAATVSWGPETIEIVAVPGSAVRVRLVGRRPVVELDDPVPNSLTASSPPSEHGSVPSTVVPLPSQVPPQPPLGPASATALPSSVVVSPSSATQTAPIPPLEGRQETLAEPPSSTVSVGGSENVDLLPPVRAAAAPTSKIEAVSGASAPSVLLPVERGVGLAAFRSGAEIIFVLDVALNLQVPRVGLDKTFAGMSSAKSQNATVIRIPAGDAQFRMSRGARGWIIAAGPPLVSPEPIASRIAREPGLPPSMRFLVSEPSRVVRVMDPASGALLLVGTQLVPGQFLARLRSQAQFVVLPTVQGVAVDPRSDDLQMRRKVDGFDLSGGPGTLGGITSSAPTAQPLGVAPPTSMLRAFSIPIDTTAGLYALLNRRVAEAGAAPALARAPARRAVAETLIALGMGVEAQSVLDVTAADDPAYAAQPSFAALRGAAALLARRMNQVSPIFDPASDGSEEIEMWRSLARVARDEMSDADGKVLAQALPMLLAYPPSLRNRFLPDALEAIAIGGQLDAATSALKTLDDPRLDLARGIVSEAAGQIDEAAAKYHTVASRPDRLARYKALLRGTEMQLKSGLIDARSAADALDRHIYAWRGEQQEIALRIRIADLRRRSGQWREALVVLREGRDAFSENKTVFDQELAVTLVAFVTGGGASRMQPTELAALYDKERELIQALPWDEASGIRFAERLASLGFQGRAEPILSGLVSRATDDGRRAFLGARLASLRMTMDDPSGTIAALADTAPPPGMPVDQPLAAARQLLYARAESERGDKERALAMLASLDSASADEIRAEIYTSRKDWPRTLESLLSLERRKELVPALDDEGRALVSRIAVAATLASDRATLDRLATSYGSAMASGPSAPTFRLMTQRPVAATGDLNRAFNEIRTAREVRDAVSAAAPLAGAR